MASMDIGLPVIRWTQKNLQMMISEADVPHLLDV